MSNELKEKLATEFKEGGRAGLSSADVANFASGKKLPDKPVEEVTGDVKTHVKADRIDPMVTVAEDGDTGRAVAEAAPNDAKSGRIEPLVDTAEEMSALESVVVTESDRELFLDALVSGERFVLPFSTFNGRLSGKFRCRSQAESYAIMQQLNRECREERIFNALEYATRLRNMLLSAQLVELNGDTYVTMQEPLLRTVDGKNVKSPGWLAQVDELEAKNEAIVSALYVELKKFERKYWLMVDKAEDQNFWSPGESI